MNLNPPSHRINLSNPEFDGNELRYIHEAFQAGQIATSGAFIPQFEQKLEEGLGEGCIVALNSGTSAIHLALLLLGVEKGDEVICQTLTFAASANPIVYLGAKPIFVDSEKQTWNICPHLLEETILDRISKGKLPKAIISVNLFGMPCQMTEIMEIAQRYGIPVVEDAAESLGSKIYGQHCGTMADIGVFSFNGNKVITTGGGGAIHTSNLKWAKRARFLSTQSKDNFPHYEHSEIGYNYKMNNIAAGIGIAQLDILHRCIRKRREIYHSYETALKGLPGISFLTEPEGYFSNRWLSTLLINPLEAGFDTNELRVFLDKQNIECRPVWKPMHLQPVYRQAMYYGGTIAESLFVQGICLPSSSHLSHQERERILECFQFMYQRNFKKSYLGKI